MCCTGTRKLKCSGEPGGCLRCKIESITCHYSQKKTIGRPRKRRHEEGEATKVNSGSVGASEVQAIGPADVGSRDSNLGHFSTNEPELDMEGFHFSGVSFERHNAFPFGAESGSIPPSTDVFSFGVPEGQTPNLEQGFPSWDSSQVLGQPFATLANYAAPLHTPPNTSPELDSNNDTTGDAVTSCSCLSNLYSMLAKFQLLPAPSFPYSAGFLRSAVSLSRRVVACHNCSRLPNTAIQNSMLLGTLLQLLIMEYAKLLKHVDERSQQTDNISLRFGDPSSLFDSRHTGLPDCPMALNIDVSGDEWRTLARKAVVQEVLGNSQDPGGLLGVVQEMRDRQSSWHDRFSKDLCVASHNADHQQRAEGHNHICVQVLQIEHLRRCIEGLGL